jgi:hypothetical protein
MIFVRGGNKVSKNQNDWECIASSIAAASTVKKKDTAKKK